MSNTDIVVTKGSLETVRRSCPKHGEHQAIMSLRIYERASNPDEMFTHPRPVSDERNYCLHCYMEALDNLGIPDMQPIASPADAGAEG